MPKKPLEPTKCLKIALFRSLRLHYGGADVRFNAPIKTVSLLAYLLIHRAEKISRESLAFTLWPDELEQKSRANLRRHILLLQQTLPKNIMWMTADYRSIQWNDACDCVVDFVEFERLSARSETAAEAAQLYAGDLLEDVYEDWLLPTRELLRRMQSVNLERIAQEHRRNRDFVQAISAAQTLLTHDPWREDAMRMLMTLRYESGDRAGALVEYEEFAQRLRRDMNAEPMPDSVARYQSILQNPPVYQIQPAYESEERTRHASSAMPFVGRDTEVIALEDAWNRAARGHGRCALISGEAGIGKTRLIAELRSTVEAQGGRTVTGNTTFPEAAPYQSIVEALRAALPMISAGNLKPIWLASAAALLPELRHLDAKSRSLAALEPGRQQDRLFEALVRCFEVIAQTRPLLVVLEDLHWAGAASIAFLEYFTRRVRTLPIFIVATFRDDETLRIHPLRAFRRSLRGDGALVNLPLGPLSPQSVEQYVSAIPQLAGFSSEYARQAYALSDGNPFFLAEIVQDSLAHNREEPARSKSLQAVIAERVARLSENARVVAGIAAVAGRAFDVEMLSAAAGLPEAKVVETVDELLDLRLIREARVNTGRSYDFVFSHDLIQASIYASVPEETRKRRHRRVGLVLESMRPNSADSIASDLARHFDEGGDSLRALQYYVTSAKNALAVYADREALSALDRALGIEGEGRQRYELLAMLEVIYGRQGMRQEQLANLEELQHLAEASTDESKICECLWRRIIYARATGDLPAQQNYASALRDRAERMHTPYWIAVANECVAAMLVSTGKCEEGRECAAEALQGFTQAQDAAGKVRALCLVAEACALLGRGAHSKIAIEQALELARESANEPLVLRSLCAAALASYLDNQYEQARDFAKKGLDLAVIAGDREGEADCLSRLATIDGRMFDIDGAVAKYSRAFDIYRALGKPSGEAVVAFNTGWLFLKIGEHKRAMEGFSTARAIFSVLKDLRGLTVCALNLGMIAYFQGRLAVARRIFASARQLAKRLENPHLDCVALANLGVAEREAGALSQALAHQEEALRLRRSITPMDLGSDLSDMGLTYLRCGDVGAAVKIADEIMALDETALESVTFPQSVLWNAAQIYAAASLKDRYRDVLQRAVRMRAELLAAIPPGPWRATYEALPFNRDIIATPGP